MKARIRTVAVRLDKKKQIYQMGEKVTKLVIWWMWEIKKRMKFKNESKCHSEKISMVYHKVAR